MNESIEPLELPPPQPLEEMDAAYLLLSDEDRNVLLHMNSMLLQILASGKGAAVLLADEKEDGTASMLAVGRAALVPSLLYSAKEAADTIFTKPDGAHLQ